MEKKEVNEIEKSIAGNIIEQEKIEKVETKFYKINLEKIKTLADIKVVFELLNIWCTQEQYEKLGTAKYFFEIDNTPRMIVESEKVK
jgi:hypothetical protein